MGLPSLSTGAPAELWIIVAFFEIGQLGEVAEVLHPPGFMITGPVEEHAGEVEVELGDGRFVLVPLGLLESVLHELQAADPVARHDVDVAGGTLLVAAIELPGHDEAIVDVVLRQALVGLGRRLQQAASSSREP